MDNKPGLVRWLVVQSDCICASIYKQLYAYVHIQFRKDYLIVVGGAKTYVKLLPYITEFYVTHVNGNYDGDTFMPEFEHLFAHQEVVKEFDGHKVVKYSK